MLWTLASSAFFFLLTLRFANAYSVTKRDLLTKRDGSWGSIDFETLVAFGDSYTDESRLGYFINHNGSAPPPGTILPPDNSTSTGGYIWPRYVVWDASTGNKSVKLYNYGVSGASCSNNLTPRFVPEIHQDYPDVENYEIPAFIDDVNFRYSNGTKALDVDPATTVYSMWIGTNDLGTNTFLTDSQVPGKTIVDYLDCVYNAIDKIAASPVNAKYFVLMNIAPLQLVPMYQLQNISGLDEGYQNATETHFRMWEQVALVNEAYEWRTMGEVLVKKRYPGMKIAVYDVNSLLTDIYNSPSQYLNGTAPANVDSYVNQCDADDNCTKNPSPDSFEWYDALHPSEQTDRIIAKEFLNVVNGHSDYAMYFG